MKKISSKKGFTLAELLIVVAIIAVLVAVAIPVFGSALDKAHVAADTANIRAAYAEELVTAMQGDTFEGKINVSAAKVCVNVVRAADGTPVTATIANGTGNTAATAKYVKVTFTGTGAAAGTIVVESLKDGNIKSTIPVDPDVTFVD